MDPESGLLEVRRRGAVVALTGEVDLTTSDLLRSELALACAFGDAAGDVVIDFSGLTFIGSTGLHVLIVDNEPLAMDALRRVLEGWGCRVSAAARENEAATAISNDPADAWLFDYHLDDDTGVALHERLRERHGARPTVILSADHTEAVRRSVHEAGLPLLMKPLKPLALKSVLDRLLAARAVS